jgi:hypothetical protein
MIFRVPTIPPYGPRYAIFPIQDYGYTLEFKRLIFYILSRTEREIEAGVVLFLKLPAQLDVLKPGFLRPSRRKLQ